MRTSSKEAVLFSGQSFIGIHHFTPRPWRMPWIPSDNNSGRKTDVRVQLVQNCFHLSSDHTLFKITLKLQLSILNRTDTVCFVVVIIILVINTVKIHNIS